MAKGRYGFQLAPLCPEIEREQIKLAKNKIRFDLELSKGDLDARIQR